MSDKRLKTHSGGIEAIWNLLASGDKFYRAAGILLLEHYASTLTANGKGEYASRLVQAFRDNDPYKFTRPKHARNKLCP